MKIVVMDGRGVNPGDLDWKLFEELGQVTVYDRTPFENEEETLRRTTGAEVVLINKTVMTEGLMQKLRPELQYIGVLATGYNVVDLEAAKRLGITVTNIPSYSTPAVAQFTFGLILELCLRIGDHNRSVKRGDWENCPDFCYWNTPQVELAGKTLGIIGYGSIGKSVAKIADAFGMKVIAHTRTPKEDAIAKMVDLDTLLSQSDIISLHCPLLTENTGLINRETIAKMKDGVLLINTARGPLIDEQDLADALRSGKVAGAAMDVLCKEPADPDNPLIPLENCIVTPHMAWAPTASRIRLLQIAADNLQSFLQGKPKNVVNP